MNIPHPQPRTLTVYTYIHIYIYIVKYCNCNPELLWRRQDPGNLWWLCGQTVTSQQSEPFRRIRTWRAASSLSFTPSTSVYSFWLISTISITQKTLTYTWILCDTMTCQVTIMQKLPEKTGLSKEALLANHGEQEVHREHVTCSFNHTSNST